MISFLHYSLTSLSFSRYADFFFLVLTSVFSRKLWFPCFTKDHSWFYNHIKQCEIGTYTFIIVVLFILFEYPVILRCGKNCWLNYVNILFLLLILLAFCLWSSASYQAEHTAAFYLENNILSSTKQLITLRLDLLILVVYMACSGFQPT